LDHTSIKYRILPEIKQQKYPPWEAGVKH